MTLPVNSAPGLVAFNRRTNKLLADLMYGRCANRAEEVRKAKEEGEKVSSRTSHQPVKAYIQRTIEDLEHYQSIPYKNK